LHEKITIYTDGGARGNPGPAAAGFVINDENQNLVQAKGIFLGKATNNFAEYSAITNALKAAKDIGAKKVELFSDSELIVKQINGQYRVKSVNLKELYNESMQLLNSFQSWKVTHVYREENTIADKLANIAMDKKMDVDRSPAKKIGGSKIKPKKPVRLAVLISGGGTTLLNLQKEIDAGKLNAEIALVISSRSEVKGVGRAKDAGFEVQILRKKDFSDIDEFSKAIEGQLLVAKVDIVVQAGWLCLWKIPAKYNNRVMNIHPALLPSFGGRGMWGHNVHEAVLKAGVKISGCTVHFCTNEYDKGPIIAQCACPVEENDTADTLAARVFEQECVAYPQAIKLFTEGKLKVIGNKVKIIEAVKKA